MSTTALMNESSLVLRAYTTVGSKDLVRSLWWIIRLTPLTLSLGLGSPDIPPIATVKPGQVCL